MSDQIILGLPDYKKFNDLEQTRNSHRRRILQTYPQGGAPLTGILSMLKNEVVDSVTHIWYEKRYMPPRSDLRGTNPVTSTAPTTGDSDTGTALADGTIAITTAVYVKVATNIGRYTQGTIIRLSSSGAQLRITEVTEGVATPDLLGYVKCLPVRAFAYVAADGANTNNVAGVGNTYGEGASGGNVKPTGYRLPIEVMNQTYIARTAMKFSGTVLKQGMEWDKSGPYKEKARDTVVDHMVDLEFQIIFGQRSTTTTPSFVAGEEDQVVRTMSGIVEFLQLWDAGDTGLQINGATYAPYNMHSAVTQDSDDLKRVIENVGGKITVDDWNVWAERVGRYHSKMSADKLVLCGSGAIMAMHKMFRKESSFDVKVGNEAYGLKFTTLITPFGDFHFTIHPLFNENPDWRYWALILDVHSLRFRPLKDRDTTLLVNRQNPGDDFRKDEYLTECTLEMWNPEFSMLIKNISDYQPN